MTEQRRLGAVIRGGRERHSWTQGELGSLIGASQQTISGWEAGRSVPDRGQRAALEQALGMSLDDSSVPVPPAPVAASRPRRTLLPLRSLSGEQFEVFCADLVGSLFKVLPHRVGGQGHVQQGVDIVVDTEDGRRLAFQCKRQERFGPAKARQAVAAVSLKADRYYLLLSRTASPAARAAIGATPAWELWDDDDLSRIVRMELEADRAERLVDTHFPGLREAFLGTPDPGPWLTPEEYFRPFRRTAGGLSHGWDLVGRGDVVTEVVRRLEDSRGAIVMGSGGSGKTRVLKAVAEAWATQGRRVRFLAEHLQLQPRHLDALKHGAWLVVVDDAHERSDLSLLLQGVTRMAPGVRLLLATRPFAEVAVRSELARANLAGFDETHRVTLRLPQLTIDDTVALARQVLTEHGGSPEHAWAIAEMTGDCPLATVVGSRLLATNAGTARSLLGEPAMREMMWRAFRNELIGGVGRGGDERDLRDLLDLVALVQPVEQDDPPFGKLAEDLLQLPRDRVVRLLGTLESAGVLRRRGRSLRVVPDVFADHLMAEACLAHGRAAPTGYADRVFGLAPPAYQLNLVLNLARLDWHASASHDTDVLASVWEGFLRTFRAADAIERWGLLRALGGISWYQPGRALELARVAIDEPTDIEAESWPFADDDHGDPALHAVPGFLRGAIQHVDYLTEVFELLWTLADRPEFDGSPTSSPDHPIGVLQEAARPRFDRIEVAEAAVAVACGWLRHGPPVSEHSPFDLLAKALEASPVRWASVEQLRARAIDAAFAALPRDPWGVQRRAIEAIRTAAFAARRRRKQDAPDHAAWTAEAVRIVERLKESILENELGPLALDRIDTMMWGLGRADDLIGMAARQVRAVIPKGPAFHLARAMAHSFAPPAFVEGRPYAEVAAGWTVYQERAIDELCLSRDANEVVEIVAAQLEPVEQPSPQFFELLFRRAPAVAGEIVERRLRRGETRFDRVLDLALAQERRTGIRTESLADAAASKDDVLLCRVIASLLTDASDGLPTPEEIAVLRDLAAHHGDEGVRVQVAELSQRVAGTSPDLALDLLATIRFGDSQQVARAVAWQFAPIGLLQVADLTPEQRNRVLESIEVSQALDDDWVGSFVGSLSVVAPIEVIELLERRIEHYIGAGSRDQPFPFDWADDHSPLRFGESGSYQEVLRAIWGWTLTHIEDNHHRFWAPLLWVAASSHYETTLSCLAEWLPSPDAGEVMTVSLLVSGAPRSFVWDQVDFVVDLLGRAEAYGPDCLDQVRADLFSCARSGIRERVPGTPSSDEVRQRDDGAAVADRLPWGSPGRSFYRDLSEAAEASIRATARMDQELDQE